MEQFKDEIIKHVDDKAVETQRHVDVVAKDIKHEVKLVAEGVSTANQRIDNVQKDVGKLNNRTEVMEVRMVSVEVKVDKLDNKVDELTNDMEIVKTDVTFIKNELVQKVSREEFVFLEKRVSTLEADTNQTK